METSVHFTQNALRAAGLNHDNAMEAPGTAGVLIKMVKNCRGQEKDQWKRRLSAMKVCTTFFVYSRLV